MRSNSNISSQWEGQRMDNLAAEYRDKRMGPAERRLQRMAESFMPNDQMEAVLKMKAEDPAAFIALSPALRMTAGYYLATKIAHEYLAKGSTADDSNQRSKKHLHAQ